MMNKTVIQEGKTMAIVAYLTWIGLIIAFIMNHDKKNDFTRWHLRQSLLLMLVGIVASFIIWIPVLGWIVGIALLVLWVIGLIGAINGETKEVPLLGKLAQDWFKGI